MFAGDNVALSRRQPMRPSAPFGTRVERSLKPITWPIRRLTPLHYKDNRNVLFFFSGPGMAPPHQSLVILTSRSIPQALALTLVAVCIAVECFAVE